ncbi:MAG: DUF4861 family protein [Bacteroidaceae bacterium]
MFENKLKRYLRRLAISVVGVLLPFVAVLADETVVFMVVNPSDFQRQEVVEIDANEVSAMLGGVADTAIVILNEVGQEVSCQITHDRRILIDAAVRPLGRLTLYARRGTPSVAKTWVWGALYKSRMDDIAWENDRCAYRVYGPALQRSGERSFGIDVWVKNTPDIVVPQRYEMEHASLAEAARLRKAGDREGAAKVLLNGSYHYDHGSGMDAYSVGPTLGCGVPALIADSVMILPYCYTDYEILDNGPLRFSVRLDFAANFLGIVEHRVITLDKGSHFNKIRVWYDNVGEPLTFCAGVVMNGEGRLHCDRDFVAYEDPTDRPKVHGSSIYTAAFFPFNDVCATKSPDGRNAVCTMPGYRGEAVTYYAGAAWSRYDVADFSVWQQVVRREMTAIRQPLRVTLSKKQ